MQSWHDPQSPNGWGLILTHGAGSNANAPLLRAIADQFANAGFFVLRYDLPYREARPHGPPFPAQAARDREGIKSAAESMRTRASKILAAGSSYGGRQTTIAASENPQMADALLLLSYPLHPPGRPDQPRTDHFPKIQTPSLFIHGTRDPFASPEELRAALSLIPAPTNLILIEGARHGLPPASAPLVASALQEFTPNHKP